MGGVAKAQLVVLVVLCWQCVSVVVELYCVGCFVSCGPVVDLSVLHSDTGSWAQGVSDHAE